MIFAMTHIPPDQHQQPHAYTTAETSGKAIGALILGILSLTSCGPIAGIIAIILGNSATDEINRSGGRLAGEGLAKAGVIMGWVSIALLVVVILFACVIFGLAGLANA